jgi:hypothetical protein
VTAGLGAGSCPSPRPGERPSCRRPAGRRRPRPGGRPLAPISGPRGISCPPLPCGSGWPRRRLARHDSPRSGRRKGHDRGRSLGAVWSSRRSGCTGAATRCCCANANPELRESAPTLRSHAERPGAAARAGTGRGRAPAGRFRGRRQPGGESPMQACSVEHDGDPDRLPCVRHVDHQQWSAAPVPQPVGAGRPRPDRQPGRAPGTPCHPAPRDRRRRTRCQCGVVIVADGLQLAPLWQPTRRRRGAYLDVPVEAEAAALSGQ